MMAFPHGRLHARCRHLHEPCSFVRCMPEHYQARVPGCHFLNFQNAMRASPHECIHGICCGAWIVSKQLTLVFHASCNMTQHGCSMYISGRQCMD